VNGSPGVRQAEIQKHRWGAGEEGKPAMEVTECTSLVICHGSTCTYDSPQGAICFGIQLQSPGMVLAAVVVSEQRSAFHGLLSMILILGTLHPEQRVMVGKNLENLCVSIHYPVRMCSPEMQRVVPNVLLSSNLWLGLHDPVLSCIVRCYRDCEINQQPFDASIGPPGQHLALPGNYFTMIIGKQDISHAMNAFFRERNTHRYRLMGTRDTFILLYDHRQQVEFLARISFMLH